MDYRKNFEIKYLKNYSAPAYLISDCHIHFNIGNESTTVYSVLKIKKNITISNRENVLELHGDNLELLSVHLNLKPVSESQMEVSKDKIRIFSAPDNFTLHIVNRIYPDTNTNLLGLYKTGKMLCTQCEAHGFSRITYFLDRSDVMASITTSVVADRNKFPVILSNGNKIEEISFGEKNHLVIWQDPYPKPCYLFALVAGQLEKISDRYLTGTKKEILLEIYVEKGNEYQCDFAMKSLKQAMKWDEKKYKREYDLDKYMIVAVSDFNVGAMENKGLNVFNTNCILAHPDSSTDKEFMRVASVISHEYFHNWTGNRITCRDWFQLSLKEGLTVYREQQFIEDTYPSSLSRIENVHYIKTQQFSEDASNLAHPVQPDSYIEVNNFYTPTIYYKGAELIRMLNRILGDERYFKGMDYYFKSMDGKAVTIDDFINCFEKANDVTLNQFKKWYKQKGTPLVEAKIEYDERNKRLNLELAQNLPQVDKELSNYPLQIPILVGFLDESGKKLVVNYTKTNIVSNEHLLELKENMQTYQFTNVNSKPIVSFLKDFTAPIKLNYQYSLLDLKILMLFENDPFSRWEASRQLHTYAILQIAKKIESNLKAEVDNKYLEIFKDLLDKEIPIKEFGITGYMLALPDMKYIIQQLNQVINIEAIYQAIDKIAQTVYSKYCKVILKLYKALDETDANTDIAIGKRILKDVLLSYITSNKDIAASNFCIQLLKTCKTMTHRLSILNYLSQCQTKERDIALDYFYEEWKNNELVVCKWLRLQSISNIPNIIGEIKTKILTHPAFDIRNPNKVRATIGAFALENLRYFHKIDGSGYAFLREKIMEIDPFNSQLSARLMQAFNDWKKFDKRRADLMLKEIVSIRDSENLSKDLHELAAKLSS